MDPTGQLRGVRTPGHPQPATPLSCRRSRRRRFSAHLQSNLTQPWSPRLYGWYYIGLGLPDIPYFTGAPVFQPQSPASRNEAAHVMKSPVFQLGPVFHQSPHTVTHFCIFVINSLIAGSLNIMVMHNAMHACLLILRRAFIIGIPSYPGLGLRLGL